VAFWPILLVFVTGIVVLSVALHRRFARAPPAGSQE
jgi:hypothetical protein